MLKLPRRGTDPRLASPPVILVTGFVLAALAGSRVPVPESLTQAVLDGLGLWALLLWASWTHGVEGGKTLGQITFTAVQVLIVPVVGAVLVVLASHRLVGLVVSTCARQGPCDFQCRAEAAGTTVGSIGSAATGTGPLGLVTLRARAR